MTFLDKLIEQRASLERPTTPLTWQALADLFNGATSAAGKAVSPSTAMQVTAVYACVTLLSETFGSLPALVYRRLERGKERASNHSLYPVVHDLPNPECTSIDFRSTLMAHVLLYGHGYAEVVRNGAGQVKQLWPIPAWRVSAVRNSRDELVYEIRLPDGAPQHMRMDRVLHIQAPLGLSPIAQAREALGLTMAAEEYGARFFSNNSTPGGMIEHPGQLSLDAQNRLKTQIESQTRGLSNAHRLLFLEEGMKWHQVGLNPQDSQFLETRKFQVGEIARLFRVPPHMIGDVEKSTSWGTGIEQQNLGFITYSLRSWLVRWEQEMNKTLLTEAERRQYFVEFLVDGLLRGDAKTRYSNYHTARQDGWLSGNDIRELENMNPAPGLDGYLVNGNMIPVDQAGKQPAAAAPVVDQDPNTQEEDDQEGEDEA